MKRLFVTLAVIVAVAVGIWFVMLWVPEWMANQYHFADSKDWAAQVTANRTWLLSLVGGIGVSITIFFTYRTFTVTQDRSVTDTMAKAIEHLGSTNPTSRLGGIYTLARIARISQSDAFSITQILTGFLRSRDRNQDKGSTPTSPNLGRFDCPDEVRAALAVIGERYGPETDGYSIDLSYTIIHNAWLASLDFSKVFFWEASFHNVYFEDANFREAQFKNASFDSCVFTGVDFTKADFSGVSIKNPSGLTKAQLQKAKNVPPSLLSVAGD